jgi:NADP-dependent 3-hydroxy acid dehydrogenase YdfG
MKHKIKVTAINPGAVETEFSLVRFKGEEEKATAAYTGFQPLVAADIADTIYYCATLPPHVCINDLSLTCVQQADTIYFNRVKA